MKTIRIQRKRKSNLTMALNWLNFTNLLVRRSLQPYIDENKAILVDARLEEIRKRTEVAEMRKQKLANELVLQDQKIEEQQMRLKLLQRELEIRRMGDNQPENGERF